MEVKVDKDEFKKFVEEELRKHEQLGSVIFPATGNAGFEKIKAGVKERIKLCKNILKQLKAGDIVKF